MHFLFDNILVKPIYNIFVFLIDFFPGHSAGLALIIVVILVRIILFPLAKKNIESQIKLKAIQSQMKEVQDKYKDNREKQTLEMMALYKNNKINPFSVFVLLLVQLPIISALYYIFKLGLPTIKVDWLYSFISQPTNIDVHYFGVNLVDKSVWLALVVVLVYVVSSQVMLAKNKPVIKNDGSFSSELQKNMIMQARFVFPVISGIFGYSLGSFVCLYLIISGLFTTFQELIIRRNIIS